MQQSLFFKLGKQVYRFRIPIILLWFILIFGCLPFLPHIMTPFQSTGFVAENSESDLTEQYINQHLGYNTNRFVVLYRSRQESAASPLFFEKIKKSLADLKDFPLKHEILWPDSNPKQISKDKHSAYAVVLFKASTPLSLTQIGQFKATIKKPKGMRMYIGGEGIFIEDVNQQTQVDLYKADRVAAPASVITLILVLGTLIAAMLPMVLGGGCALIILTVLYFLGHAFSLSIFTLNIALLLGLCLSLDYALFIIFRFRDELSENGHPLDEIIARTVATAGRAVFFSGLAVFISLSALLFFPINILFSVGVGGLAAVFVSVLLAVTLLPACLGVLKNGINGFWSFSQKTFIQKTQPWKVWHKLAVMVVNHRIFFISCTLVILLCFGYPFLSVRFGISDLHILPEQTQGYQFLKVYEKHFDPNELTPIFLLVQTKQGRILSSENIEKLYHFTQRLKRNPLIKEVNGIVSVSNQLNLLQYQTLYRLPKHLLAPGMQQMLKVSTARDFTVITVVSRYNANSSKTMKLVKQLRQMNPGSGLKLHLTGEPVNNADVLHSIGQVFPYMLIWIVLLTYLILLLLLHSVFLPLKAIIVNILSLCASYGVLVYVFQKGHFHQFLHFNPQGMLDISLLIIIFCALFGFSMDYEVFLLTRIKEGYDQTGDTNQGVIFGIEKSSKIISSAAIIVIILCGSFMLADVLMVKEFGLGIAVAIFVDAFIIRILLVPAVMSLIQRWNWYMPRWLERILP